MMRLARALALAGVASRRQAEILIKDGEISVNGEVIKNVATNVEPDADDIRVNGQRIRSERKAYLILNKPRGVVSTVKDTHGRRTVLDLVPRKMLGRLYPVGRLDRESSGLMLLTNDGELAFRLTHPRFHVVKKYQVRLNRPLENEDRLRLEKGVHIEGGRTAPCRIRTYATSSHAEVELFEGRKHQIRLMFYTRRYDVKRLERTAIGPIVLKGLPSGGVRALSETEVERLKKSVGLE